MKRLIYLAFDNLHRECGALASANPKEDSIVLVESQNLLNSQEWHLQRLFFLLSCARHFAADLTREGFDVHYVKAPTTLEGILSVREITGATIVVATEPSSHRLLEQLKSDVTFIENDFFLTPRKVFSQWAEGQKKLLMENFYRFQRQRLEVLVDEYGDPEGGSWNFDKENRLSLPKDYEFKPYLNHPYDEIDQQVLSELQEFNCWGDEPDGTWATTRAGALKQLDYFLVHHLDNFGPYEDAMSTENWAIHHSLLSPYLNNGLLNPEEVLAKVLDAAQERSIPIASLEGFIRQLIGWREYVNGIYWIFEPEYRSSNFWKGERNLPAFFKDPSKTEMNCMRDTLESIQSRSWVHHIPRLMLLSNFALLSGISPQVFLSWMRQMFIDAADWVMVPNVIGMSMNADGGRITSKPYIAGGSYVSKMSNYCGSCRFNPKTRSESDSCPFTTLYWNFIDENFDTLARNNRIVKQIYGIKRLKDLAELRERAAYLLEEFFE